MRNKILLALTVLAAAVLAWMAFFWHPGQPTGSTHTAAPTAAVPTGGDFSLQSSAGTVRLQDHRGKVVLLYFGYTFCPDICPASLAVVAQALSALDESELRQVQALFISVDPERDTPEKLKDYAAYFHSAMAGVTGSIEELTAATALYGASFQKQEPKSDGGYVVDHSTFTYVVDQNGVLVASLPHGTPATDLLAQIRKLVRQQLSTPPSPPSAVQ